MEPDSPAKEDSPSLHLGINGAHFEAMKEEVAALPPHELLRVAFDAQTVVMTILGCRPNIEPYREAMLELPRRAAQAFDDLPRYCGALLHTHSVHGITLDPEEPIAEWVAALKKHHEALRATAEILGRRNLLNGAPRPEVARRASHADLIHHTLALTFLLEKSWDQIEGKTPYTKDSLASIERDALRLMRAVGARKQRISVRVATADTRRRVYTLTVRAYEEVRRAISYIRWFEGDADEIAAPLKSHPMKDERRARDARLGAHRGRSAKGGAR